MLLFFIAFRLSSQNLVINSGFEIWQKISKPEGWTTALSCAKDSLVIYSGLYSCKQATASDSKELGQLIPVSAGSNYTLSVKYYSDVSGTGNGCRIWSGWKDADGNTISDEASLPLLHSGYLKSESWNSYDVEIIAPEGAHYFNLIIRTLPNSITYWDEIVFEESIPTLYPETNFNNVTIYPNPASNYLIINNLNEIQQIDIQTITGIKVWSKRILREENLLVPVQEFKNGLYIISFRNKGRYFTRKFIKSNCY